MRLGAQSIISASLGLVLLAGAAPLAAKQRSDPLKVPAGPAPGPEQIAHLPPAERLEQAAEAFRERGYRDLPVRAWGLLEMARASGDTRLAERASELAPRTPGVHFESALLRRDPLGVLHALWALVTTLPGLVWLAAWLGAAVGLGALATCGVVLLLGFARSLTLHGHALGHLVMRRDPLSWPGVLILLALLATLAALGLGPALILGVAGALGLSRMRGSDAAAMTAALLTLGLVLGPATTFWARALVLQSPGRSLLTVWRLENGQPLPADTARLERALEAREDPIVRLVLATLWTREGDLDRAHATLAAFPNEAARPLRSRALNRVGTLHLARGEVEDAIRVFESARSQEESAAVLFNLSQAYGRALRLSDQGSLFAAARARDPDLVSQYTGFEGANLHRYLIEDPIPLRFYLASALRRSPEADAIAAQVRGYTLGSVVPAMAAGAFPLLVVLAWVFRFRGLGRCNRCMRLVCRTCTPEAVTRFTCVRCTHLFVHGASADPRLRQRERERHRARERVLNGGLAVLGLLVPGGVRLVDGRAFLGGSQLLVTLTALGMWPAARLMATPFEVGGLAWGLPLLGLVAGVPLWVWGATQAVLRLARREDAA